MRLKLSNWDIVMREVPDEITLALNLSECPNNCKGCHSPQLRHSIGSELTFELLDTLIKSSDGITCVAFMGGDRFPEDVSYLAQLVHSEYFGTLKTAWYSGKDYISDKINPKNFDYVKVGSYIENKGPLDNPNTNQRMYQYSPLFSSCIEGLGAGWRDITNRFWNK